MKGKKASKIRILMSLMKKYKKIKHVKANILIQEEGLKSRTVVVKNETTKFVFPNTSKNGRIKLLKNTNPKVFGRSLFSYEIKESFELPINE